MYQQHITTADQALVHLAFHCSLKDGDLQEAELDFLSATFAAKGLNKELDLKAEMLAYRSYTEAVKDESSFLHFLIETISPQHKLALLAFCAEIVYDDAGMAASEKTLLTKIAALLQISEAENMTIQNLIAEMNAVEKNNAF